MKYYPENADGSKQYKAKKLLRLRKVAYQDEKNRYFEFLTNNFEITAEEVAFLYKKRWGIELLFKKMKQNFQLHYFYGQNENAITYASMVYIDSPTFNDCHPKQSTNKEGILDSRLTCQNKPDKYA